MCYLFSNYCKSDLEIYIYLAQYQQPALGPNDIDQHHMEDRTLNLSRNTGLNENASSPKGSHLSSSLNLTKQN